MLDEQPFVNIFPAMAEMFWDSQAMQNEFYKELKSGMIQINHCFDGTVDNPTVMNVKEDRDAINKLQNLKKGMLSAEEWMQQMRTYKFKQLLQPGLKDIKRVELYKKWHPFVPVEFQDEICPQPPENVIKKNQKEQSDKQANKEAQPSK